MKKIGLLINPISGMGGSVGLKGTDGKDTLFKAIKLGALPNAPNKVIESLKELKEIQDQVMFITGAGELGENVLKQLGFKYELAYKESEGIIYTTEKDSENLLRNLINYDIDILLFAGGDGTARLVANIIKENIVCVAIPTGVKIHSSVFAINPKVAGKLTKEYLIEGLTTGLEEVVDLNEEMYRNNIVVTDLYGYLKIPRKEKYLQNKKAPTPLSQEETLQAISLDVIDNLENDIYYFIGAGTTTSYIMKKLSLDYSLLGVDVIRNRELIRRDCNEKDLLEFAKKGKCILYITPTGGQGFIFGRGNQQISDVVLRKIGKENIRILADISKLINLRGRPLIIYTGNDVIDDDFSGYYKVKIGYGRDMLYKVTNKF